MKNTWKVLGLIIVLMLLVKCGGPSEPTTYTHSTGRFAITMPAGWNKTAEDEESYEFRKGNVKLIEVVGFSLEMTPEDFAEHSDEEFMEQLEDEVLDALDGYCGEAEINDYVIKDQRRTTWGGHKAYHVRAGGFSDPANVRMVVDLIGTVNKNTGYLYMFASQIAEDEYSNTKDALENTMSSFKTIP